MNDLYDRKENSIHVKDIGFENGYSNLLKLGISRRLEGLCV